MSQPPSRESSAQNWTRWVIRSVRLTHPDPAVRSNQSFRLERPGGGWVRPAEFSLYESELNHRPLTTALMRNYAVALHRPPGTFADLHSYLARNRATSEPTGRMSSEHIDVAHEVLRGDRDEPTDWVIAAQAIASEVIPVGTRTRQLVVDRLIDRLKLFAGHDYRIIREAALLMGEHLLDPIQEEVAANPARAFHLIEPLGFLNAPQSSRVLEGVLDDGESWITPTVLETYTRQIALSTPAASHRQFVEDVMRRYLEASDPIVQQQASQLAATVGVDDVLRRALAGHDNRDVRRRWQLQREPEDVLLIDELHTLVEDQLATPARLPDRLPVLLREAVLGHARQRRSEAAWILQVSAFRQPVADASWSILTRRSTLPVELQASLVRLIGRLGGQDVGDRLTTIATDETRPTAVRTAALWDLPGVIAHASEPAWMLRTLEASSDRVLRRAVITAAGASSQVGVVAAGLDDADDLVRAEARRWR